MKTKCISRAMMRFILMCVIAAGVMFAYSGLAPADTKTAYADSNTDMRAVIEDQKLYEVLQVLANYEKENNQSFYAGVEDSYSKDITGMDEAKPYLAQPLTQETLEAYDDEVNLAPYGELTTLEGLNSAKGVNKLVLPKTLDPDGEEGEAAPVPYSAIDVSTCSDMSELKTVVMPVTVTEIGESAFWRCKKLTTIRQYEGDYSENYPDGIINTGFDLSNVINIGSKAFASCDAMTSVDLLSAKGKSINIGANAFELCTALTSVDIPKGSIGAAVFSGCAKLENVTFNDEYDTVPSNFLSGAGSSTANGIEVHFPQKLTNIESYAFADSKLGSTNLSQCKQLSEVNDYAFQNASFSGWVCDLAGTALNKIGNEAFEGVDFNISNGSVILPENQNFDMGVGAFALTSGLTSVKLPTSLEKIPAGAFLYSYDLANITSYGDTYIETIGNHAFDMCGHLSDLSFFNDYCPELTTIGDYAFARCVPKKNDYVAEGENIGLNSVIVNDSVTKIGKYAFKDDFVVATADFGNGTTMIPEGLICCSVSDNITKTDVTFEDVELKVNENKTVKYEFATGSGGYSAVRTAYSGYSKSLYKLSSLKNVTISKDTHCIGAKAFLGSFSLEKLTYDGDTETENGIHLPGKVAPITEESEVIEALGNYAFAYTSSIDKVILSSGIKTIPANCFRESGLEAISSLNNVENIGNYAFYHCGNLAKNITAAGRLKDFAFGSNLKELGEYSFAGTAINDSFGLDKTKIEILQRYTFEGCSELEDVLCPDSLAEIKDFAFKDCVNLTKITFPVYTSLSKKMLGSRDDTLSNINMEATMGKFVGSIYKVPITGTISLPADAFVWCSNEKFYQIDPDDIDHPIDLDDQDHEKYFSVVHNNKSYSISGNGKAKQGTGCIVSATLLFDNVVKPVRLSATYPIDVTEVHAKTIEYDTEGFKLSSGTLGIVKEEDGEQVLYINSNYKNRVLTLSADAYADEDYGDYNKGLITDTPVWSSTKDSVLKLDQSSPKKDTSSEVCNISAKFMIGEAGETEIKATFDKGEEGKEIPSKMLTVKVVNPIQSIKYTVAGLGEKNINPAKHAMKVGQKDKITATGEYDENAKEQKDKIYYSSDNEEIATVDNNGSINAVAKGKTNVRIKTATGSVNKTIEVTVVGKDEEVQPLYVDIDGTIGEDGKAVCYIGEPAEFAAICYPAQAAQNVSWTVSQPDYADLKVQEGKAVLTAKEPGKNLILSAKTANGVTKTLSVVTIQKASSLLFRETSPYIGVDDVKYFKLSSNQSQDNGIIRVPGTAMDDVTFTSSDSSVLVLGHSSDSCTDDSVTLSGASKTLYYKGLKEGNATITAKSAGGKTATLKVTVVGQPITGLRFAETEITLEKGAKKKLDLQKIPANSTERVTFESSNTSVATVDATGTVTAVSPGSTKITAKSSIGKATATCRINVPNEAVKATALVFRETPPYIGANDVKYLKLSSDQSQQNGIIRVPGTAIDDVTFTSSNSSVLVLGNSSDSCNKGSVTLSGSSRNLYYKGLKDGTATITAKSAGGKTAKLTVTVVGQPVTSLSFTETEITLKKGANKKLSVKKTPASSTERITFESSDTSVAKVDASGVVTAVGPGSTKIKARSVIGKATATCKIKVPAQGVPASGLVFRETPPYIKINDVRHFKLSSDQSQENGIIRMPQTSTDDVTFTSGNSSVLVLGSSSDACNKSSVTLTGVSGNLYYKGLKDGSTTITATTEGGKTATLKVTVVGQPITALSFTEKDIMLMKGAKKKPGLKKTPAGSTEKVTFESSNTSVAKVDASGTVTAVGSGTAKITARSTINKVGATCNIKVPKPGETIKVDGNTYKVNSNNTLTFKRINSGVKKLTIPAAVTIAGQPYNVTAIAAKACPGNNALKKLVIGNKVVKIGNNAFEKCKSLTTLVIGKAVKNIGKKAFYKCKKLKTIKIKTKKLKKIGKGAFKKINKKAKFKCPKSKKKAYKKKLKKSGIPKKAKIK